MTRIYTKHPENDQKVDVFDQKPKRKPWWEEIQRLKQLDREAKGLVQRVGDRRSRVYAFVIAYKKVHDGCSPQLREIQSGCEFKDHVAVGAVLRRLEREGKLKLHKVGQRSMEIYVVGATWDMPGADNIINGLSV